MCIRDRPWPGNVRQLENVCRWLTVMAAGKEIQLSDLPPELSEAAIESSNEHVGWESLLSKWASAQLNGGEQRILDRATPSFEKTMIEVALTHTHGRKRDAAVLLGWGRNTLTRKLKELDIDAAALKN